VCIAAFKTMMLCGRGSEQSSSRDLASFFKPLADRAEHFFLRRLGSDSLYIAAPKTGRAEVPVLSMGGEGAVGRPRSHEAAVFFGLAKSFKCDESRAAAGARHAVL